MSRPVEHPADFSNLSRWHTLSFYRHAIYFLLLTVPVIWLYWLKLDGDFDASLEESTAVDPTTIDALPAGENITITALGLVPASVGFLPLISLNVTTLANNITTNLTSNYVADPIIRAFLQPNVTQLSDPGDPPAFWNPTNPNFAPLVDLWLNSRDNTRFINSHIIPALAAIDRYITETSEGKIIPAIEELQDFSDFLQNTLLRAVEQQAKLLGDLTAAVNNQQEFSQELQDNLIPQIQELSTALTTTVNNLNSVQASVTNNQANLQILADDLAQVRNKVTAMIPVLNNLESRVLSQTDARVEAHFSQFQLGLLGLTAAIFAGSVLVVLLINACYRTRRARLAMGDLDAKAVDRTLTGEALPVSSAIAVKQRALAPQEHAQSRYFDREPETAVQKTHGSKMGGLATLRLAMSSMEEFMRLYLFATFYQDTHTSVGAIYAKQAIDLLMGQRLLTTEQAAQAQAGEWQQQAQDLFALLNTHAAPAADVMVQVTQEHCNAWVQATSSALDYAQLTLPQLTETKLYKLGKALRADLSASKLTADEAAASLSLFFRQLTLAQCPPELMQTVVQGFFAADLEAKAPVDFDLFPNEAAAQAKIAENQRVTAWGKGIFNQCSPNLRAALLHLCFSNVGGSHAIRKANACLGSHLAHMVEGTSLRYSNAYAWAAIVLAVDAVLWFLVAQEKDWSSNVQLGLAIATATGLVLGFGSMGLKCLQRCKSDKTRIVALLSANGGLTSTLMPDQDEVVSKIKALQVRYQAALTADPVSQQKCDSLKQGLSAAMVTYTEAQVRKSAFANEQSPEQRARNALNGQAVEVPAQAPADPLAVAENQQQGQVVIPVGNRARSAFPPTCPGDRTAALGIEDVKRLIQDAYAKMRADGGTRFTTANPMLQKTKLYNRAKTHAVNAIKALRGYPHDEQSEAQRTFIATRVGEAGVAQDEQFLVDLYEQAGCMVRNALAK